MPNQEGERLPCPGYPAFDRKSQLVWGCGLVAVWGADLCVAFDVRDGRYSIHVSMMVRCGAPGLRVSQKILDIIGDL